MGDKYLIHALSFRALPVPEASVAKTAKQLQSKSPTIRLNRILFRDSSNRRNDKKQRNCEKVPFCFTENLFICPLCHSKRNPYQHFGSEDREAVSPFVIQSTGKNLQHLHFIYPHPNVYPNTSGNREDLKLLFRKIGSRLLNNNEHKKIPR